MNDKLWKNDPNQRPIFDVYEDWTVKEWLVWFFRGREPEPRIKTRGLIRSLGKPFDVTWYEDEGK